MKTIIFIGSQKSGSSREAIKAAEHLGYYTVLFTDRPSFLEKRDEFPDVHLMQMHDLRNIKALKQAIRHLISKALDVHAIVSFVDPHCYTASLLAKEFGLNHFSTEAMGKMENKIFSREALSNSPYNPYFMTLSHNSPLPIEGVESRLPLIIKSPNSAGSKDVFKVDTFKAFKASVKRLFTKYPEEPVLVEEFLDGPQYLIETIVYNGQLYIIAIIEQEITFSNGHFIVTGYNLLINPPDSIYESLIIAIQSILTDLGMESGPCHLEMRYVNNEWKLVEINPRISGGGMNEMLEIGLGINLVEETLKMLLGQEPNLEPRHEVNTFAKYVILTKSGRLDKVTGKNKALSCPGVKSVYIKARKGAMLTPPFSMGDRYAYVIATGYNEQNAEENAKYASSQIEFHTMPYPEEGQESASADTKKRPIFVVDNL